MKIRPLWLLAVLLVGMLAMTQVKASPADYLVLPTVHAGERELDIKYGANSPVAGIGAQAASIGLGYGATEAWFTEVYFKRERYGAQDATLAEWENKFQLSETGQYAVDVGLVTELEAPVSGRAPWSLRFGPLLQTEFGKWQLNGNLLFERAFGRADEDGVPFVTNLGYQWQAKYRWQAALELGLQGMGEVGRWDNWSKQAEQNHRIGPAVFGKFSLGKRQAIKYNAAWLFGTSAAAPNHTFRMQVEYEY